MSLALLAPLGLFGLFGLLLPILVHLTRRAEQRLTVFPALRWLRAEVRPRSRIRVAEIWLLLARLLLIALLVLLIAEPVISGWPLGKAARVVLAPGVDPAQARALVEDDKAEWLWLREGFPRVTETAALPWSTPAQTASLLRELDAQLPAEAPLTIIVPSELAGLDGAGIGLSHRVDWRVLPGRSPENPAPVAPAPRRIAVRYTPAAADALRYVEAAVAAWNSATDRAIKLDLQDVGAAIGSDAAYLIWLGAPLSEQAQSWIAGGGIAVTDSAGSGADPVSWRRADGTVLARVSGLGQGRVIHLESALTPATLPELLDADFPRQLLEQLRGPAPAPTWADGSGVSPGRGGSSTASVASSLDSLLMLLIALLFAIERALALRPDRKSS